MFHDEASPSLNQSFGDLCITNGLGKAIGISQFVFQALISPQLNALTGGKMHCTQAFPCNRGYGFPQLLETYEQVNHGSFYMNTLVEN